MQAQLRRLHRVRRRISIYCRARVAGRIRRTVHSLTSPADQGRRRLSLAELSGSLRRACAGAGGVAWAALRSRACVRTLRIFAGLFATVALLSALAFGGLMLRLAQGPIEIDGIGQRVADAMTRRFNGAVQFSFGATRIARTEHGPTITVDRVKAVAAGRTVVEAPRAELSLDPLALLRAEALPRRFEIYQLTVRLLVMPTGALAISAGGPNEEAIILSRPELAQPADEQAAPVNPAAPGLAPPKPRRTAVLKEAAGALRAFFDLATSPDSPLAALRAVAVHGGSLVVDDRAADRTTTFDKLEMAFERSGATATFLLGANGPNGTVKVVAKASGAPSTERRLDIEVSNLSMDEIALVAGMRRFVVDSDAALSFKLRFIMDASKELREASGRVNVGAGFFRLEDPDHEPLFFDEIAGGFHWDPVNRRILIDSLQYFGGETHFVAAGALEPPSGGQEGWRVSVGLTEPGRIGPDRPKDKVLTIEKASADARVFIDEKRCDISRAEILGPEISLAASGAFDWVDGPHIRLGLSAGQMPLRALLRVWPSQMGAPARTWMLGHVHAGVVQSAKLAIDFDKDALLAMRFDRPPPDESLQIDFHVAGAALTAVPGVPDLSGVEGSGRITGRSALFGGASGAMETSATRKLTLTGASFSMPQNDGNPAAAARVEARVSGSVEAVAELLAKEAINPVASMPLEPGSLKGQVDGKARIDFKIGPAARPDDVKVYVNAGVANFSADRLIGKEKFEAPMLTVAGDPSGIQATGAGRIFGATATLDLRKGLGQPATATLTGTVDEAARAKLGLPFPGVSGPVAVKVAATLDRETRAHVELDLARTGLDNPIPGLTKAAGRPGKASFVAIQRDGGVRFDDFVFDAGGASAKGVIELNGQGDFLAARLSQARLSPGDEMKVDVQKSGDGFKATVRGASIDGRPFIKSVTQASESGRQESGDLEIDLKAPILTGYSKQALANAELKIARRGGTLRQFAMGGNFGRAPFSATLGRGENGSPQVNVSTADAGALLAFTDLYPRMEGGALNAAMQLADKSVTGMLTIRSFHLRDEPALRRLALESSPRVDPNGTVRFDSSLVRFDRLQVVFSRTGGKLMLRDGVMHGPNIGLTVEGLVDEDRDQMALNGTFVPAYTVNNFFAKIPVVGMILGGGWNEGLFAVNYKVTGRPNAPQISINPLTVAPGFLRKIFGVLDNAGSGDGMAPPSR